MSEKHVRSWKKVFEQDLHYVINELKEAIARPVCLILTGEMGAGKTTFVKYFSGGAPEVQSPTYSLITESANFVHADFYRLKESDEIYQLELPLYLETKEYFLVEWGKQHLRTLLRELDDRFMVYELTIEINKKNETVLQSRNYHLFQIDRNSF